MECNGGPIVLTKSWAKSLLQRRFIKRRASSKGKVSAANFQLLKEQFLFDIEMIIDMEDIPADLVLNWDQTGIHYICTIFQLYHGERGVKEGRDCWNRR